MIGKEINMLRFLFFLYVVITLGCSSQFSFIGEDGRNHHLYKGNNSVTNYSGSFLESNLFESFPDKVDNQSLENKLLFGYQGWFSTPDGDYKAWKHWSSDDDIFSTPFPTNASFDFWPDTSEYKIRYPIQFDNSYLLSSRGDPVYVFSNEDYETVDLHFKWMREHNLDGVFHLRFVSPISEISSGIFSFKSKVLHNIRLAAENYGRVFAIRYNITDPSSINNPKGNVLNEYEVITKDWMSLVDRGLTKSSAYLHHNKLPVVSVYGIGFNKAMTTASYIQQKKILEFFTSNPIPKYRAFVVGGVPTRWRDSASSDYISKDESEGGGDAAKSTEFEPFYKLYNKKYMGAIHPWHVGRFNSDTLETFYTSVIIPDANEALSRGLLYMPTLWPGFSWAHLKKQKSAAHWNFIPRDGGNFYWRQLVLFASNKNVNALFSANFDEVDEGTAMFKQIATPIDLPDPNNIFYSDPYGGFIPLNIDGYEVPNNFYLILANYASRVLKKRILLSSLGQKIPNIPVLKSLSYSEYFESRCIKVHPYSETLITLYLEVQNPFNEYENEKINPGGYILNVIKRINGTDVYPLSIAYINQNMLSLTFSLHDILPGTYPIRVKSYINYSPYVLLFIDNSKQPCPN